MAALSKNCGFIYSIYSYTTYASYKGAKSINNYIVYVSKKRANKIAFLTLILRSIKKCVLNFGEATKKHQLFFMEKIVNRYKNDVLIMLKYSVYKPYKRNFGFSKGYFSCFL